jgi:cell division protein FtsB
VKWLIAGLLLFLVFLQYRLWFGDGGLEEISRLQVRVEEQRVINRHLQERNTQLEVEVLELQEGLEGVEERARSQLGMVKEGEIFYQLLEEELPMTSGATDDTPDQTIDSPSQ